MHRLLVFLFAALAASVSAEDIHWGIQTNGLALGIGNNALTGAVSICIGNFGKNAQVALIPLNSKQELHYNLEARTKDGTPVQVKKDVSGGTVFAPPERLSSGKIRREGFSVRSVRPRPNLLALFIDDIRLDNFFEKPDESPKDIVLMLPLFVMTPDSEYKLLPLRISGEWKDGVFVPTNPKTQK